MQIKQVVETEDGTITFEGTLEGKELEAVITVGLNYLLKVGAMPFEMPDNPRMQ